MSRAVVVALAVVLLGAAVLGAEAPCFAACEVEARSDSCHVAPGAMAAPRSSCHGMFEAPQDLPRKAILPIPAFEAAAPSAPFLSATHHGHLAAAVVTRPLTGRTPIYHLKQALLL